MIPIIHNATYLLDPNLMNFDTPIEIHVTRFLINSNPQHKLIAKESQPNDTFLLDTSYIHNSENFKVYLDSNEPSICSMKETENNIIIFSSFYNLILTSNENLINKLPNAKLFLYGTTWLNKQIGDKTYLGYVDDSFNGFSVIKDNTISFLITNKHKQMIEQVSGYQLRIKLWSLKDNINNSTLFYCSNEYLNWRPEIKHDGILPNNDKMELFKSKFSIIIENSQEKNYFSEKLIDCLLTKTIPIYWGCPNIEEYFNGDGFIFINDESDFLQKVNSINIEEYYNSKKDIIESNFQIAKKYSLNYSKRVETEIKKYK
tara:strand:+ start:3329 stop:4276 length:948 start_codon:yes stop_codon:yes gene_type:complete